MTTRVTIQISHASQPVEVQVLARQRDGSFATTMPPTRIEREGDVVTFHVHGNQRLQVVEVEGDIVTGDGSGEALPEITDTPTRRTAPARVKPVPPPLPVAASAAILDDADRATAGADTSEDSTHA
ncbi:MAG: hypothetical protein ABIU96_03955 [Rhodanobacter sp.]